MGGLKLGIGGKIWSLVGLMVVGLTLLVAEGLLSTRQTMVEDRRHALKQQVETAVSLAVAYQGRAAKGEITDDAARALAMDAIRALRYGNNEYFVLIDQHYVTIMHPLRADLNGKDMSQAKDPNGVYFARDQVDIANRDGSGYVAYQFPRVKDQPPVPKLGYAQAFRPWGWTVLSGVYIDDIDEAFHDKVIDVSLKALLVLALAAVLGSLIARSITKPLARLVQRMGALATGDTGQQVEDTERRDEMGELARAMEVFRGNSLENKRLLDEQESLKQTAAEERHRVLRDMATGLETRVKGAVEAMSRVGERLNGASVAMSRTAEQTSQQTTAVVAATEQTSSNVQTVASAAEELSASGGEIGRQVALSAEIARAAAEEAGQTNTMVSSLAAAAGRIGEVVRLIDDIASQTNLLALNATIEAARAGEAGKGFAVVANEVKTLANQTAKATQEITAQIGSVQTETDRAVAAIRHIGETINRVDEATASIAGAVEEQNAAIHEITRSVQEAARGTREVSDHIGRVSDGARTSRSAADEVAGSSREMIGHNDELTREIASFLSEVRAQAR